MKHGIDLDETDGDYSWYRRDRSPSRPWFDFTTLEAVVAISESERDQLKMYPHLGSPTYGTFRLATSNDEHEIATGRHHEAWNCVDHRKPEDQNDDEDGDD